jgi:hypothetical protein
MERAIDAIHTFLAQKRLARFLADHLSFANPEERWDDDIYSASEVIILVMKMWHDAVSVVKSAAWQSQQLT